MVGYAVATWGLHWPRLLSPLLHPQSASHKMPHCFSSSHITCRGNLPQQAEEAFSRNFHRLTFSAPSCHILQGKLSLQRKWNCHHWLIPVFPDVSAYLNHLGIFQNSKAQGIPHKQWNHTGGWEWGSQASAFSEASQVITCAGRPGGQGLTCSGFPLLAGLGSLSSRMLNQVWR